jgi:hypothetical protein
MTFYDVSSDILLFLGVGILAMLEKICSKLIVKKIFQPQVTKGLTTVTAQHIENFD